MRKRVIGVFCVVFLLSFVSGAFGDEKEEETIRNFFAPETKVSEDMFSESFLNKVSIKDVLDVRGRVLNTLGDFKEVVPDGKKYKLRFEKGTCPSVIRLDDDGKISSFWIGAMRLTEDTLGKVIADFLKLDGKVSITILRDGSQNIATIEPDLPLAVGSTFKLYVLEALRKKMAAENLGWNTVIAMKESSYSLPSGITHKWPVGTPVTLQTLAHLMISISDNTATDHLLHYVSRKNVENVAPARVRPFYSTADMFRLKYGMEASERDRYLAADLAGKRETLAGLSKISLEDVKFQAKPSFIDTLEWHITTRELCHVIYRLRESSSLRINPALAIKEDWKVVGYKGGSEPGVLNQTYLLKKDEASPWLSISVTINNPKKEIDEEKFNDLITRLLHLASTDKLD